MSLSHCLKTYVNLPLYFIRRKIMEKGLKYIYSITSSESAAAEHYARKNKVDEVTEPRGEKTQNLRQRRESTDGRHTKYRPCSLMPAPAILAVAFLSVPGNAQCQIWTNLNLREKLNFLLLKSITKMPRVLCFLYSASLIIRRSVSY